MIGGTRRWTPSIWHALSLFWAAVCLLPLPAAGQTNDVAAAKEALSRLTQFSNDVRKMHELASRPLGPYPIATQCTWCDYAWGELCWTYKTATISGPPIDFNWTRRALETTLSNVENDAGTFAKSYEPTQAWINGLPKFSAKFDVTADRILGVQADIKAGKVPSDQQRQVVKQALQELADDLSSSSAPLQSGTQALATALQRLSSYAESIQQAIAGADRSAQEALTQFGQQTQSLPCQNEFKAKFDGIKGDFSRSIGEISAAFQKVQSSSRQAQEGLAVVLGGVVSSQTDLQSVIEQVKAAKNDELGSFLERLHLTAAKKRWEDLASAASGMSNNTN
jgi:hypothetical protein